MDFTLTEEQQLLRRTVHEFAVRELEPGARERDADEKFDPELYRRVAGLGLLGLGIPPEHGGGGGGLVETAIATEELSRSDPSMALSAMVSLSLCAAPIERFGTDRHRERYVPALARGEAIGAYAQSEPNAGSDAGAIATTAVRRDGNYVLNGGKIFISNADVADTIIVIASQDPSQRTHGMVALIVESGTPGLTARKQRDKLGMRGSSTAELFFEDCPVPVENRMGEEGEGFKIAMQTLEASRPIIGAQALGIAQGCLDLALKHTQQRRQFGQAIADFQGVQWMLADMATQIDAARLLVYRAASLRDHGHSSAKEASMAKLFASETAMKVASTALQLHGGYGYFKESPVERYFRDAKVTEIYEGTSQIQRLVIARQLLAEVVT
jgi:alkylation response protein AidB-like acyl-CoA dehydrogenase